MPLPAFTLCHSLGCESKTSGNHAQTQENIFDWLLNLVFKGHPSCHLLLHSRSRSALIWSLSLSLSDRQQAGILNHLVNREN